MPYPDNPYPPAAEGRVSRLESRVDQIDQRVSLTEANWARLDERSARIADDVHQMRSDIHAGLTRIEGTVANRSASINKIAWFLGTTLILTLVAVIVDLGVRF